MAKHPKKWDQKVLSKLENSQLVELVLKMHTEKQKTERDHHRQTSQLEAQVKAQMTQLKSQATELVHSKAAQESLREQIARLEKQLDFEQRQKRIDPLTELHLLSGIIEEAEHHFRIWKRHDVKGASNGPLSVVFIDMNKLKTVNDTYGHNEGDKLIKEVALVLKSQVRAEDLICRRTEGGDEFIIVLPHVNEKDALKVIEKIRIAFENYDYTIEGHSVELTASFGASAADSKHTNIGELIEEAEARMYLEKKKNGQGRI